MAPNRPQTLIGLDVSVGSKATLWRSLRYFRFSPEKRYSSAGTACLKGARTRHPVVTRSVKLEHLFEEFLDCLFGLAVKNGPDGSELRLPLFPRKRTQVGHRAMSGLCHNPTSWLVQCLRSSFRGSPY